jgi:uncharacterized protein
MHGFTPVPALLGGALIGIAAAAALLLHGRLAGISGIFAGLLHDEGRANGDARAFRLLFLGGLLAGAAVLRLVWPAVFEVPATTPSTLVRFGAAGLLVGFGARLSGGCTSGHGVCGLSLRSERSLAATVTFMASAVLVVFVTAHMFGAAR